MAKQSICTSSVFCTALIQKDSKTMFHVPIMLRVRTAEGIVNKKVLLTQESTAIDLPSAMDWCVVNEGGHGFYRVRYSVEMLKNIRTNMNQFASIERFNLVNDTWAAVLAGLTPLSEYLELIKLFTDERDKNVWTVIVGSLQYLDRVTAKDKATKAVEPLQALTRNLLSAAHKRFGWESQAQDDELTNTASRHDHCHPGHHRRRQGSARKRLREVSKTFMRD